MYKKGEKILELGKEFLSLILHLGVKILKIKEK